MNIFVDNRFEICIYGIGIRRIGFNADLAALFAFSLPGIPT